MQEPNIRTSSNALKLSSLGIASLRKLVEEADKLYDRKHDFYQTTLRTRCYTQHALRPYIDSEINYTRHFIKIPFINKGIDFIDLPSIFRDNTVESSIPDYIENKESSIICYKYNTPIRSTIFNFNKLVADLDIDNQRTSGPVNAHLTSWPSKAQDMQNLENIW